MAVGVQVPLRVPNAGIAQLVEHDLAKVGVASSSLVSRSSSKPYRISDTVFLFIINQFSSLRFTLIFGWINLFFIT